MKIWLGLAVGLFLAGCTGPSVHDPGTTKQTWTDVPPPINMEYESGYGNATPEGTLRVYTQVYTGLRSAADLVTFYTTVFPVNGWTLVKSDGTDPAKLTFEKKAEKCDVEVTGGLKSKVVVKLGAKS